MRIFEIDGRGDSFRADGAGAIAIGNFDGVHLGHREVIARVVDKARELGVPSGVMTFEPYPREYFDPVDAPPRLTSLRHKVELLERTGIDRVYCLRFGRRLATTAAPDFVSDILVARLNVSHVTVGVDFRFGARRAGDVELLTHLGRELGFGVSGVDDFQQGGERVSSSRIRRLLSIGDLEHAAALLGRPFSWQGRVIHGDKRGRTWGFPTANLTARRDAFPVKGVFVVHASGEDGFSAHGVANVGRRPTVDGTRLLIEVHLFDFSGDLYGRRLEITFLEQVRQERRFDSFDALKEQISRDVVYARQWLKEHDCED